MKARALFGSWSCRSILYAPAIKGAIAGDRIAIHTSKGNTFYLRWILRDTGEFVVDD